MKSANILTKAQELELHDRFTKHTAKIQLLDKLRILILQLEDNATCEHHYNYLRAIQRCLEASNFEMLQDFCNYTWGKKNLRSHYKGMKFADKFQQLTILVNNFN